MATRRSWFVWHSWVGLTAGLLLFVICWSGTVAVFSREIDMLLDARLQAGGSGEEVAWGAIYDSIGEAWPGWTINQISAPYAPGFAAEAWMEDEHGVMRRIHADPATGAITGTTSYFNVQRFFRSFHMSLFVGEYPVFGIPLGYFIVGLFSFVLLASTVTSLLFYRRFWRGFLKLQTHRGAKVFWSDTHKLTGLWSLWFIIAIALTGIWYLVEWKTPESPPGPPARPAVEGRSLPIDELVRAARAAYPELRVGTVAFDRMNESLFVVHGQDGAWLVRDRAAKAWVDSRTGAVVAIQRPSALTLYQRWIDTADPLHFGNFGGLWSKSIWFLFGLLLSGMALSGAYLQAKRQQRWHIDRYRPAVLGAYLATVGILLLASYHGYRELLTYGVAGRLPEVPVGQVAFIAIWVVVTVAVLTAWMRAVR